ncbi:membrane-associated protease RseP (regulator of RpoE activity) [Streptomyces umbrinus]|uniref:PDZ domain-containing protein n=1 Tax=Streptomyces umbrinus TaxID=67370 RepID=UPI00167980C5|nr:PDZ domain-containing protein [Streptomyces umbrinus]MCR3726491.1 membrane-associated protease RseP (regulator of RpoE activity) [Streptomyces umbrinus]MCX4561914.1 PDZ domain-containing protein [Streptomyces phaeochromogenes]GHB89839.1 PDZ domain-containing protein [Streptomyces umbrinus]GHH32961.1 PDZ domain-containing protein [Streptomyces umbrinus]
MEQTALRPKPMPGREPGQESGQEPGGGRPPGTVRRPHAARRRGRRLMTLLFSLFVGAVLVLSGIGLGTVGATVIGMSKLADLQREAGQAGGAPGASGPAQGTGKGTAEGPGQGSAQGPGGSKSAPGAGSSASPKNPSRDPRSDTPEERQTLGVEAVDAPNGPGALLVGVHVPGPGHTAGLVRGDVLLTFGRTRVDSAADLARAVAAARPGTAVTLTLRHTSGGYQQLSVTPGVVT